MSKFIDHLSEPIISMKKYDNETRELISTHVIMSNGAFYLILILYIAACFVEISA